MKALHATAIWILLWSLGIGGLLAQDAAPRPNSGKPMPKGSLQDRYIRFQMAVYFPSAPKEEPVAKLDSLLLAREGKKFQRVDEVPKPSGVWEPWVVAAVVSNVPDNYRVPDPEHLKIFGRGLSRRQSKALQDSKQALVLDFGWNADRSEEAMAWALQLMRDLATESNGFIWDEETREIFTPKEWSAQRLLADGRANPEISAQTVVHAYRTGAFVRVITLGMLKFGLPDLVVENLSWSQNRSMAQLVNLVSQRLLEGEPVASGGAFVVDLGKIKTDSVRTRAIEGTHPNAIQKVTLTLRRGFREEGDPANRLAEIGFDSLEGVDLHAQQERAISMLFGWEDSISRIEHDEPVLAASRKARKALPRLQADFQKGLGPGEYLLVKAPFPSPKGGQEWMWVEVVSWQNETIRGLLRNEPFDIPDMHAGQMVQVSEKDVFDYLRQSPDGTTEGNKTGEILQRREEPSKK